MSLGINLAIALPLWLKLSLISFDISAKVNPLEISSNIGSYPNPFVPLGLNNIVPKHFSSISNIISPSGVARQTFARKYALRS